MLLYFVRYETVVTREEISLHACVFTACITEQLSAIDIDLLEASYNFVLIIR